MQGNALFSPYILTNRERNASIGYQMSFGYSSIRHSLFRHQFPALKALPELYVGALLNLCM